jgi:hypothetical protein
MLGVALSADTYSPIQTRPGPITALDPLTVDARFPVVAYDATAYAWFDPGYELPLSP